ncbi:hypothetical protein ACFLUM_03270 [Chloroflexota bacterium]
MPILKDIPVELTPEQVVASQGKRRISTGLLQDAGNAIALAQTLWQPQAVYDWFDVSGLDGEYLTVLSSAASAVGAVLHIGSKADLLAATQVLLVGVGTIGPALERQVRDLQMAGESLQSYLLDSAGVVALGAVGEALRCLAEETAGEQGWGVSAALSPGSLVGWQLQGQRDLCGLLPLDSIGVELNEYFVLKPHKSFSVAIGLGPGYASVKVGSVCRYCALKDTCWRRRGDPS